MSDPVIAAKVAATLDLEPGTYWWCSCGRSQNQPFCDGSHKGTEFTPMKFVLEKKKKLSLCQCKRTQKPPYCDQTHRNLE